MDILKKIFPLSFRFADTVVNLVIGILIYVVACAVAGFVLSLLGILSAIPVVGVILGWLLGVIGSIIGLYGLIGIVLELLVFFKVIK